MTDDYKITRFYLKPPLYKIIYIPAPKIKYLTPTI